LGYELVNRAIKKSLSKDGYKAKIKNQICKMRGQVV